MKKGFTLVEVVVALALLVIVVAVVSTAFALNGRVNAAANHKITAQEVAINATEELRYIAMHDSTNRNNLLEHLKTSDQFGNYDDSTSNVYVFNSHETYTLTLSFIGEGDSKDMLVKLTAELKNGITFETLEWLEYAGT